jgi:hypothetical protein
MLAIPIQLKTSYYIVMFSNPAGSATFADDPEYRGRLDGLHGTKYTRQ